MAGCDKESISLITPVGQGIILSWTPASPRVPGGL